MRKRWSGSLGDARALDDALDGGVGREGEGRVGARGDAQRRREEEHDRRAEEREEGVALLPEARVHRLQAEQALLVLVLARVAVGRRRARVEGAVLLQEEDRRQVDEHEPKVGEDERAAAEAELDD